jgi:hypothetical protein
MNECSSFTRTIFVYHPIAVAAAEENTTERSHATVSHAYADEADDAGDDDGDGEDDDDDDDDDDCYLSLGSRDRRLCLPDWEDVEAVQDEDFLYGSHPYECQSNSY